MRKMTNGTDTFNIVKWGQNSFFDEWFITDKITEEYTFVIIDNDQIAFGEWIDLSLPSEFKPVRFHSEIDMMTPQHTYNGGKIKWL